MSAARVLVIQNDAEDPPGPLEGWLAEGGLEPEVVAGPDLPDDLARYAAVVVLGGGMGASDDHVAPWLPRERELLREAVSREVPVLGICLGAQLLAVAHGGRVERSTSGPEIGAQLVAKRSTAAGDPLFGPLPITPDVLQWHFDAITVLPPGAINLYSSPVCEHQAFRLGRLAWAVQFHIETTPQVARQWAIEDAGELEGYDLDAILSRIEATQDDMTEVWRPFVHRFAAVATEPASVPAPRTVPTSTAEPITDPAAIRAALAAEAVAARDPGPLAPVALPLPTPRPDDGATAGDGARPQ